MDLGKSYFVLNAKTYSNNTWVYKNNFFKLCRLHLAHDCLLDGALRPDGLFDMPNSNWFDIFQNLLIDIDISNSALRSDGWPIRESSTPRFFGSLCRNALCYPPLLLVLFPLLWLMCRCLWVFFNVCPYVLNSFLTSFFWYLVVVVEVVKVPFQM